MLNTFCSNSLWAHGNPMFCILRCSQQLLDPRPRFDVTERLLTNVEVAHSLSAKYFHVLMKATTAHPLDEVELLRDLWALVMTRNLHNYRLDILGGDTSTGYIFSNISHLYVRFSDHHSALRSHTHCSKKLLKFPMVRPN